VLTHKVCASDFNYSNAQTNLFLVARFKMESDKQLLLLHCAVKALVVRLCTRLGLPYFFSAITLTVELTMSSGEDVITGAFDLTQFDL
jgi:hypothetical protein